jgi:glutamine---fructose-6-phosphate transaminase (isomerizing)
MCGIVGAISERPVSKLLIEGLRRLEYRGYDSAGITLCDSNSTALNTFRKKGKIKALNEIIDHTTTTERIGIGHTRWATHGEPSLRNAHPHCSGDDIAIVHNGIIENYAQLREQLINEGYSFQSDTDSEVIAHLLHKIQQQEPDMAKALHQVTQQLKGAYAIGCINKQQPDTLYAARQGSPLVIGIGFDENFIASDTLALLPVTQSFIYLEEGDIACIKKDNITIYDNHLNLANRAVKTTAMTATQVEKGEHRHFMIKEIHEQPSVVNDTLAAVLDNNRIKLKAFGNNAPDILKDVKRIHIIACGTSLHAGHVAKHWITRHAKIPCTTEIASEHRYRHHAIEAGTLFIALSQSGETADTLAAMRQAKALGYTATLAICNVPESSLVREADLCFLTQAGSEIGVAATKTFTAQLIALACLTIGLQQTKAPNDSTINQKIDALKSVPKLINQLLKVEPSIEKLAIQFISKEHALFLGRGKQYAIAMEAALKLKEISYIHAESYASGELKHGPIALIDEHMPVVILAPNNELIDKILSNTEEVQARGGQLFVFSDYSIDNKTNLTHINMPSVDDFISPIIYNIPMQLLAYHVAVLKGTDIDQPRNLAKSVTVE